MPNEKEPDPIVIAELAKQLRAALPEDTEELDAVSVESCLDEAVYRATDHIASNINNSGLEGQLEYLLQQDGEKAVREMVAGIIQENS